MLEFQKQFIQYVIDHNILRFGSFTLKSGRISPYFFNAGLFNTGAKLAFLGNCYAAAVATAGTEFDTLFGPAYKGIPLVSITAYALAETQGIDKPYCFNRKEVKDHGEGGLIVGAPLQGRVLIVDDVITAGTAIREAVTIIESQSASLAGIVVSLDRQEKGSGELSAIQEIEQLHGIKVISIVGLDDIVKFLQQQGDLALNQHLDAVVAYQQQYGVGYAA